MPAMKLPIIRLIDLGYDDGFGKSMTFAQSLIESINVSGARADVEYVRTTDMALVAHALTVPARLIHIMGHGMKGPTDVAFGGTDGHGYADPVKTLSLTDLGLYLQDADEESRQPLCSPTAATAPRASSRRRYANRSRRTSCTSVQHERSTGTSARRSIRSCMARCSAQRARAGTLGLGMERRGA